MKRCTMCCMGFREKFFETTGIKLWQLALLFLAVLVSVWCYVSRGDVVVHGWFMDQWGSYAAQRTFGLLSRMGQAWFEIVVCVGAGVVYYRAGKPHYTRAFYLSIVAFLAAGVVGAVLKNLFGRPRPKLLDQMYDFQWFEVASRFHSYPSGHAITTFCLLATVAGLYSKRVQAALWVAAVVLATARVGIGSHWPADVVFGGALGFAVGLYFRHRWQLTAPPSPPILPGNRQLAADVHENACDK